MTSARVFHRLGQDVEHMCFSEGREGASGDVVGGREPQGMLWVGGSLRGCCGWEGASGDVMGGREPQGMLWGGGGPFGNVDRLVCVCVCLHVCIVFVLSLC